MSIVKVKSACLEYKELRRQNGKSEIGWSHRYFGAILAASWEQKITIIFSYNIRDDKC